MPDDITIGVVAFDPERTMATTKDMVTKMVNDITTDTTNRVMGTGKKMTTKLHTDRKDKPFFGHGEAKICIWNCQQPSTSEGCTNVLRRALSLKEADALQLSRVNGLL